MLGSSLMRSALFLFLQGLVVLGIGDFHMCASRISHHVERKSLILWTFFVWWEVKHLEVMCHRRCQDDEDQIYQYSFIGRDNRLFRTTEIEVDDSYLEVVSTMARSSHW